MEAWIVAAVLAAGAVYLWNRWRQLARAEFIRNYTFPHGLFAKLNAKRPQLDTKQMQLVARALRQFFLAYLRLRTPLRVDAIPGHRRLVARVHSLHAPL